MNRAGREVLLARLGAVVGERLTAEAIHPGLVGAVNDAIAVLDRELTVIAINRRCADLFQLPEESGAAGVSIFDLLPEASLAIVASIVDDALESRVTARELVATRADGRSIVLEVRASVLRDGVGGVAGFAVVMADVSLRRAAEEPLALILEGTSGATGDAFFPSLVKHLALALGMRHALVGEIVRGGTGDRVRTLAVWADGVVGENGEYELAGTPCEVAVASGICVYRSGVRAAFPTDVALQTMGAESYVGAKLRDSTGSPIGVLAVLDSRSLDRAGQVQALVELFAARAAAELERLRVEHALRDSQQRLQTAVSGTSEGLFDLCLSTDLVYLSPPCAALLGYRGVDGSVPATGAELWELIHPDDRSIVNASTAGSFSLGSGTMVLRVRRRDGQYRSFECRTTIVVDHRNRPKRYVGFVRDVTETRRLERLLEATSRIAKVGGWELDVATGNISWTDEVYHIFGTTPDQFRPTPATVLPFFDQDALRRLNVLLQCDRIPDHGREATIKIRNAKDQDVWVRIVVDPEVVGGRVVRWIGAVQDITAFRQLEEQLIRAQKMEGIGRLAGGVAHDFNNLLTAILGACEVAAMTMPSTSEALVELAEIRRAATSAGMLTRQLLALARKEVVAPKSVQLDRLVAEVSGLIQRVVGSGVTVHLSTSSRVWPVLADPGQLEQVILNLAINARDAMAGRGRLSIEVANEPGLILPGREPGDYVVLRVRDTGAGMTDAVKDRVFEPFFTTKPVGQGTGLGLATCHGIVAQAGGAITVESTLGVGSTFGVYLPRHAGPSGSAESRPVAPGLGHETILIVEDEEGVRRVSRRVLERYGYRVLEARSGEDAVAMVDSLGVGPHLALVDVVLPGASGLETARLLRERIPGVATLFMTGYADEPALDSLAPDERAAVIRKPFTSDELGWQVRQLLDARLVLS